MYHFKSRYIIPVTLFHSILANYIDQIHVSETVHVTFEIVNLNLCSFTVNKIFKLKTALNLKQM